MKSFESRTKVSIVLPAYNEERAIGGVLARIRALRIPHSEVLVVDDGSTDGTARVAVEHGARVIRHPYNIGNGAAVKTGLRAARGELVVLMDGDGQHAPQDVPSLLEKAAEGYDMVVAARVRGSRAPWQRKLANWIYNRFASYVTQFPVRDLTSGFRVVRRRAALRFLGLLPNRFSYPTTLTLAFLRSGLSVHYLPVPHHERIGKSKIRPWEDGIRFLLIIAKIATLFSPFRVFLPVSGAFFATGLGYYLYTYFTQHRFTNMSVLLFTTSVVIFMMGLVSEQIALLRMERIEADGGARTVPLRAVSGPGRGADEPGARTLLP
ncbi:MAG: glycosyl transferase [Candidatus Binatia bacterium]|nr:MAG: glycosyl transferase [Candidatus Binatia bacterium]